MDNSTYWFFEQFSEDNFSLLYDGNINDDITDKIIGLSEHNFEHHNEFNKAKKRVSFLMAECFQNIIRHGGKIDKNKSGNVDAGFFLTRNIVGQYFITSGNLIRNENVAELKTKLNEVNILDKNSLRKLYVDVLANKGFSEKGGAGLGLIEIARKSGQKIEFVFDKFQDNHSIFYNQITLHAKKEVKQGRYISTYHITEAIKFHRKMLEKDIFMIQKGDFSHSSILPVLEILEKNLPALFKNSPSKKEVYHVIVEILQNISKYALEKDGRKDGIFMISRKGNNFVVSAGNFVEEFHINPLETQIQLLNNLTKEELKKKYLKALKKNNKDGEARIELIEIARRSKEAIQYNFKAQKPGKFFFTISVTV